MDSLSEHERSPNVSDKPAVLIDEQRQAGGGQAESDTDDPLLDALVALAEQLERPVSGSALIDGLPLEKGRLTPELLPRAAARAGLSAKLTPCSLSKLHDIILPCLIFLSDGRVWLLCRWDDHGKATVLMPETGRGAQRVDKETLEQHYLGMALLARPEIGHSARERDIAALGRVHWFWGAIRQQWPIFSEVLIASIVINMLALVSPLFIMNVYDRVVPNNAVETLWALAIGAGIAFSFDFILKTLRGYFVDASGRVSDVRIASRIFEQVLGIRLQAKPPSAGAFANNLREFESLRDLMSSATIAALVDLPFIMLFLAVIWFIGGPLAIVPATAVPIVLLVAFVMQWPMDHAVRRSFKEAAQRHGILVETIYGLETVKSVGASSLLQRSFERFVEASGRSTGRVRFFSALTLNFAGFSANLVMIGVVIAGVYYIGEGDLTVGALVACTILSGRVMAPLSQVAGLLTRLYQGRLAYQTLDTIMGLEVDRSVDTQYLHRSKLNGAIEFRGVDFNYPGQNLKAVAGLSFSIKAGEKVGVVGRIGSGKSTIGKLILGLYEPDQGAILLDGTELRQIDPADRRRNIAAVPQDVVLFRGSIRDNIQIGVPGTSDAALMRAAEISGVQEFVGRHPEGFDADVGERGEVLSGGQRQAVALARALITDAPILVFDEPTSAMDNGAENRLKTRLTAYMAQRTMVLITHRASLLSLVDRLLVLDNGRLVADGPRDDVLDALATGKIKGAK
ncbi:MAG: type I secretion system permease/ATPase [Pseudomonadota bacterium]